MIEVVERNRPNSEPTSKDTPNSKDYTFSKQIDCRPVMGHCRAIYGLSTFAQIKDCEGTIIVPGRLDEETELWESIRRRDVEEDTIRRG